MRTDVCGLQLDFKGKGYVECESVSLFIEVNRFFPFFEVSRNVGYRAPTVKDGSSGAICRAFNLFENRLHLVIPLNSLFSAGKAGDRGREGAVSKAGSDG